MANKKIDKDRKLIKDGITSNGQAGGEALLKLVNILGDTTANKLPQLTKLSIRQIFPLSIQATVEKIDNAERIKKRIPLSQIWRETYFQLLRSVDRWYFQQLAGLAHEQAAAEAEKAEEEQEW